MDMISKPLFARGKSNNLGKLYGKWKAKRDEIMMQIEICEHGLV